jgi:hypothetical protein
MPWRGAAAAGSELGWQVAVDLETDADLNEGRRGPGHIGPHLPDAFTSDDYREPPAFLRKLVALRSRSKALRSHHIPLIVASSRAEDDGDAAKSHPHFD